MLSCGIDSLAMFALNRKTYAEDHPRRLTAGIVVNGFDCANDEQYARVLNAARRIGSSVGIELQKKLRWNGACLFTEHPIGSKAECRSVTPGVELSTESCTGAGDIRPLTFASFGAMHKLPAPR